MKVENPLAYSFILHDDIYLVNRDKAEYSQTKSPQSQVVTQYHPVIVETEPAGFKYIGGYKKKFLVIVHYPELEFIAETHFTALENILKRLGLTIDDIAIVNLAKYPGATAAQLTDFFNPQKMLLLGDDSMPIDIEALSLNKPKAVNGCSTLYSFSFAEMMDNTEYKKAFWEQMKQI